MTDTHRDLTTYIARAAQLARDKFTAENPSLFLVRLPENVGVESDPWGEDFSFATRVAGLNDDEEDRPDHAAIIAPVVKREGGPFPDLIGIGRARNCDVVLRFASVSKLHAQLRRDPQGAWSLLDLDSANGTAVDGVTVKARVATPLQLGAKLRIGTIEVELLDAGTLFDRLRARIGR